jgi:hypothetical protein
MSPTTKLLTLIAGVVLLGCSTGNPYVPEEDPILIRANRRAEMLAGLVVVETERAGLRVYPNIENFLEGPNPALALYREEVTRDRVIDFFVSTAGSEAIALPILYYADRMDIPLSLAFSLVWAESRFDPRAVNRNSSSIDRGLFQLNSASFRHLTEDDFFTPSVTSPRTISSPRKSTRCTDCATSSSVCSRERRTLRRSRSTTRVCPASSGAGLRRSPSATSTRS